MDRITAAVAQFRHAQAARTCACGKPSVQSGIMPQLSADDRKLLSFLDSQGIRFCSLDCFVIHTALEAQKEA
jgi:hypothetical protein